MEDNECEGEKSDTRNSKLKEPLSLTYKQYSSCTTTHKFFMALNGHVVQESARMPNTCANALDVQKK